MIIELNKDNIQIIIQLLGLLSVALLAFQIYLTNKWNRKIQSLNQLDHSFIVDNIKLLKDAGFNIKQFPMNESDFTKLLDDNNIHLKKAADNVLKKLEFFSIAYNMNMFDKHYIFHSYSMDIKEVYEYLLPLIKHSSKLDETYYSEFKKCYKSIMRIENFEQFKVKLHNIFLKR
jgi:hypothetical protein